MNTNQPLPMFSAHMCAGWQHTAHCSLGRLDVDVQGLGVDMLTLVGHKFGAPKGVGALFVKRGVKLVNLLSGGSQEGGRRAG
jgi:cysteine desulfurase